MSPFRFLGRVIFIWLIGTGIARAQPKQPPGDIQIIRIRLHEPVAARPLRHRLLPSLREQTDGNARDWYKKANDAIPLERGEYDEQLREQLRKWEELRLDEPAAKRLRKELEPYAKVFDFIEKGALCESVDWGHREVLKKQGIAFEMPVLDKTRLFVQFLVVRTHVELAEGDIEAALRTTRLGLGIACHAHESPILISALGAATACRIHLNELDRMLSHPKMPSLYWALSDLPTPMFDFRKAYEGEYLSLLGMFPEMIDIALDKNAGPLSAEKLRKFSENMFSEPSVKNFGSRRALASAILSRHNIAKKALIADGRPKEKVETMPHIQVAFLHSILEYEQLLGEAVKWNSHPFHVGYPHVKRLADRLPREKGERPAPAPVIPLAEVMIPAVDKVLVARVAVDRKIAALRVVEAIRLHVAKHGSFPAKLDEIDLVPVPNDPMTGKPFEYQCTKDGATLDVGRVPNVNSHGHYRYQLTKSDG